MVRISDVFIKLLQLLLVQRQSKYTSLVLTIQRRFTRKNIPNYLVNHNLSSPRPEPAVLSLTLVHFRFVSDDENPSSEGGSSTSLSFSVEDINLVGRVRAPNV